jgi:hypothetical protein
MDAGTIRFAKSDKRPTAIKAEAPGHVVDELLVNQALLGSFAKTRQSGGMTLCC